MYDVMIIDDDTAVRDHLKDIINWESLGLRLVCEAGDSELAQELYTLYAPKIVITDINIPTISGLDLAREFLKVDPEIRFIVITGYSDFEYVRDAVALGAVELLPKPLFPNDINRSLQKAVAYFDELRRQQTSSNLLMQLVEENLPMLRDRYAAYLLHPHAGLRQSDIDYRLNMLGMDISGNHFAVVLIESGITETGRAGPETSMIALKNLSDKLLESADFSRYSLFDDGYRLSCIAGWNSSNGEEVLEQTLNRLSEQGRFLFQTELSIGIGKPVPSLLELPVSAAQASSALNCREGMENGEIISYKNVAWMEIPAPLYRDPLLLELGNYFRANRPDSLRATIDRYFSEQAAHKIDIKQLREFAQECISLLYPLSFSLGLSAAVIPDYPGVLARISSCSDAEELRQHLLEVTDLLLKALFQKRSDSKNRMISAAKEYINANLRNPKLSLEIVSSEIGLSSIYFCKLFHKVNGISFNEYVNSQRIRLAQKLLAETNKKVFEVCYDAGYSDPKYFNRIFKRLTGTTPLEYKNSL